MGNNLAEEGSIDRQPTGWFAQLCNRESDLYVEFREALKAAESDLAGATRVPGLVVDFIVRDGRQVRTAVLSDGFVAWPLGPIDGRDRPDVIVRGTAGEIAEFLVDDRSLRQAQFDNIVVLASTAPEACERAFRIVTRQLRSVLPPETLS